MITTRIVYQYLRQCQKIVVSGMRYDFPKLRYYWVSGNPLRYIPETNIKLAKVLYIRRDLNRGVFLESKPLDLDVPNSSVRAP